MFRTHSIALAVGLFACGSPPEEVPLDEPTVSPQPPAVRRLTTSQYERVVVDLFGEGLVMPTSLEPDVAFEGLQSIGVQAMVGSGSLDPLRAGPHEAGLAGLTGVSQVSAVFRGGSVGGPRPVLGGRGTAGDGQRCEKPESSAHGPSGR